MEANNDLYNIHFYNITNAPRPSQHFIIGKRCCYLYRGLVKLDLDERFYKHDYDKILLQVRMCSGFKPCMITPYAISEPWDCYVDWSDQPEYLSTVLGPTIEVTDLKEYKFDITEIVDYWKLTGENNGIMLKTDEKYCNQYAYIDDCYEAKIIIIKKDECCLKFKEDVEEIIVNPFRTFTEPQRTTNSTMTTFFVKNTGDSTITAQVQISPDNVNYANDYGPFEIEPGEILPLVPYIFAKFTRLVLFAETGTTSEATIWYQSQNWGKEKWDKYKKER